MKPPVSGIVIFLKTAGTEGKTGHSSIWTVVRNGPCYGIAGAAVRAVDKGIEVSPVGRIKQFPKAIIADRYIRRYQGKGQVARLIHAFFDGKIGVAMDRKRDYRDIGNLRERWGFVLKTADELRDAGSLHVNEYPFARVGHLSLEVEGPGKVEDERPEAHSLHDTFNYDLSPLSH